MNPQKYEYIPLSDDELEFYIGIDEDGNISPVAIALAMTDITMSPTLFEFINAEQDYD